MKMGDRITSAALLERQHKEHLATISIPNAKSLASVSAHKSGFYESASANALRTTSMDSLGNSNHSNSSKNSRSKAAKNRIDEDDDDDDERDNPSKKGEKKINTGRWSTEEHKRFLKGLEQFGTGSWKRITEMVGTRSCTQIRTHAQKYFIALQKPTNDPNNEGGYNRKKSKMLIGLDEKTTSKFKRQSSRRNGMAPVLDSPKAASDKEEEQRVQRFWASDRLTSGTSGLTGMEVLAQAAINGGSRPAAGHRSYENESSLDQAVSELRKKMASEADAVKAQTLRPCLTSSNSDFINENSESKKRALEDAHIALHNEHNKKLKESSEYAAAVQDTIERKDVLRKLQAAAERQEIRTLRKETSTLKQTILQLQQQSIESDNRVMEAITDRRVTLNECKNLREINAQLKQELRRMVLLFEHTGGTPNGGAPSLMAAATQGANIELMQARLTESELRYHTVTESLSRQTGVLTDQHRAILELNTQLEQERTKRQAAEFELAKLKASSRLL